MLVMDGRIECGTVETKDRTPSSESEENEEIGTEIVPEPDGDGVERMPSVSVNGTASSGSCVVTIFPSLSSVR